MASVIKKCTCKNEYQDKKYGTGMRVMNPMSKTKKGMHKCTVCGRIH